MREIKYQLWTGSEMIEVGSITFHTDGSYHVNDEFPVNDYKAPGGNPPYRLREWTGLKDKNGKEIYEGDIVHNKALSMRGLVKYDNFKNALGEYHGWYIYRHMKVGKDKISTWESPHWIVIGNIYENPELLN